MYVDEINGSPTIIPASKQCKANDLQFGCCIGGSGLGILSSNLRLSMSNPALPSLVVDGVDRNTADRHCRLPFRNGGMIGLYSSGSAH
jgi:hypothetical protein